MKPLFPHLAVVLTLALGSAAQAADPDDKKPTEAKADEKPAAKGDEAKGDEKKTEPAKGDDKAEPAKGDDKAEDAKAEPAKGDDKAEPAKGDDKAEPAKGDDKAEPAKGDDKAEDAKGDDKAEGDDKAGDEAKAEDAKGDDKAAADDKSGEDVVDEEAEIAAEMAGASKPSLMEDARDVVVVSDLQMGLGKTEAGWDAREDFRWTRAWSGFLDNLAARSKPIDLVIAGDLLELQEAPADLGCSGADCNAEQMKTLVGKITEAHAADLALIGDWSARTGNRVFVIPGPHDKQLSDAVVWASVVTAMARPVDPEVLATLRPAPEPPPEDEAEGEDGEGDDAEKDDAKNDDAKKDDAKKDDAKKDEAETEEGDGDEAEEDARPQPQITLVQGTFWNTADGKVVVEPGPGGSAWAQSLVGKLEADIPLLDNVRPSYSSVLFVAPEAAEDPNGLADAVRDLIVRSAPTQPNPLLHNPRKDNPPPKWNARKARKRGHLLFVDGLAPDDPLRAELLNGDDDIWDPVRQTLRDRAKALSDDEVFAICDRAAIYHGLYKRRGAYPRCDGPKGRTTRIADGRANLLRGKVREHQERFTALRVYVTSASHTPTFGWEVDLDPQGMERVDVYDSGAFTRLADPHLLRSMTAKRLSKNRKEVVPADLRESLAAFDLRHLPACYSAVFVSYSDEAVEPELKNWYMPDNAEQGKLLEPCAKQCGWVSEACLK